MKSSERTSYKGVWCGAAVVLTVLSAELVVHADHSMLGLVVPAATQALAALALTIAIGRR